MELTSELAQARRYEQYSHESSPGYHSPRVISPSLNLCYAIRLGSSKSHHGCCCAGPPGSGGLLVESSWAMTHPQIHRYMNDVAHLTTRSKRLLGTHLDSTDVRTV